MDNPSGITVTGSGHAAAAVDEVTISLAVDVLRPDAGDAFRIAAQTVSRLLAVLADDGVGARNVRTLDLNLGPRTEWRDNREILIGYAANQRLAVRLDALDGIERLLSDVAQHSGNGVRIDGLSLNAKDPQDAIRMARELAFEDAARRASHYAELAGRALGPVEWIQEGGVEHFPRQKTAMAFARSEAPQQDASMPIAGGDSEVSASVTVRWSFAAA